MSIKTKPSPEHCKACGEIATKLANIELNIFEVDKEGMSNGESDPIEVSSDYYCVDCLAEFKNKLKRVK